MLRDIAQFIFALVITLCAIVLGLILIYASPDEKPHLLAAAISHFAASYYLSAYIFTLKKSIHVILKWVIILFSGWLVINCARVGFTLLFPPIGYTADKIAGNIFILSAVIVSVSLFFLGRRMSKKIGNLNEQ